MNSDGSLCPPKNQSEWISFKYLNAHSKTDILITKNYDPAFITRMLILVAIIFIMILDADCKMQTVNSIQNYAP